MGLALLLAVLPVAAGAALGLARGGPALIAPIRTFALVSAMAVVLGQLLPDALDELGLQAALAFTLGFALPALVERAEASLKRNPMTYGHSMVGLHIGYAGLLVHQLGDGLAMGAISSSAPPDHAPLVVLLAIAAHKVPVTAFVVLAFAAHGGARSAAARAAGLALVTAGGVVVAGLVDATVVELWEPWVTAAVGGLLLHVVAHDWHPEHTHGEPDGHQVDPKTPGHTPGEPARRAPRRLLDLLAFAAGLSVLWLGSAHPHAGAGEDTIRTRAAVALVDLALQTAPLLLVGLVAGAALQLAGARIRLDHLRSWSKARQALCGALMGVVLPAHAWRPLPMARALGARGGGPALVVAFLFATPALGVETLVLTGHFLGWRLTVVRVVTSIALAAAAALLAGAFVRSSADAPGRVMARGRLDGDAIGGSLRALEHFEELLRRVGPWMLAGLITAAYAQAALPAGALAGGRASGLDVLLVSVVALPSYVCAAAATPLAAVLLAKGLTPGAALAGLLLGPPVHRATLTFLRGRLGAGALLAALAWLALATWGVAAWLNLSPSPAGPPPGLAPEPVAHGPLAWGAAACLGLFTLRALYEGGVRAWLGTLGESLRDPGDEPG